MKILTILLTGSVFTVANTAKVTEPTKHVYQVLDGESFNKHKKKLALAADLAYSSEHVGVDEISDINITITTSLQSGILQVNLSALDEDLKGLAKEDMEFKLSASEENSFPINLQVSSEVEGIHYINLTLSVEGEGANVFVVPVNVGEVANVLSNKKLETTDEGIAISVSQAQEEIQ